MRGHRGGSPLTSRRTPRSRCSQLSKRAACACRSGTSRSIRRRWRRPPSNSQRGGQRRGGGVWVGHRSQLAPGDPISKPGGDVSGCPESQACLPDSTDARKGDQRRVPRAATVSAMSFSRPTKLVTSAGSRERSGIHPLGFGRNDGVHDTAEVRVVEDVARQSSSWACRRMCSCRERRVSTVLDRVPRQAVHESVGTTRAPRPAGRAIQREHQLSLWPFSQGLLRRESANRPTTWSCAPRTRSMSKRSSMAVSRNSSNRIASRWRSARRRTPRGPARATARALGPAFPRPYRGWSATIPDAAGKPLELAASISSGRAERDNQAAG